MSSTVQETDLLIEYISDVTDVISDVTDVNQSNVCPAATQILLVFVLD